MKEEMKRIDEMKRQRTINEAARSTNLTGEQLFIRSCNQCHPDGRKGMGPSLENVDHDFPDDTSLKGLLRKGKGIMPGQPVQMVNDAELTSLVVYVRQVSRGINEKKKAAKGTAGGG
jgi:mono/diheme cytochrome c family protein